MPRQTGDPRSTQRHQKLRSRMFEWGEANQIGCGRPDCQMPGQPVRYDLRGTNHPQAPNVGHIVELDRGGDPYDVANMRIEHQFCNKSAGARYVNSKRAPRRQSRDWFRS